MITLEVKHSASSSLKNHTAKFRSGGGPFMSSGGIREKGVAEFHPVFDCLALCFRQPGLFVTSNSVVMKRSEKTHLPALVTDPHSGAVYDFGALFGLLSDEQLNPADLSQIFEEIADSLPHVLNEDNCEFITSVQNALYWIVRLRNVFRTAKNQLS